MTDQKGFTLIELLVVIGILGILVAIALPYFNHYKGNAHCGRVVSDTKNAFIALEGYYAENSEYGAIENTAFRHSPGVSVQINSRDPLVISGTDETGTCTAGNVYTLSQASGVGEWK